MLFVLDVSLQGAATPDGPMSSPKTEARKGLLGMLPRIMASIARLWSAVQSSELLREDLEKTQEYPSFSMGTPKVSLSIKLKTMVLCMYVYIYSQTCFSDHLSTKATCVVSLENGFSLNHVLKEPVYKDHFLCFPRVVAIDRFDCIT